MGCTNSRTPVEEETFVSIADRCAALRAFTENDAATFVGTGISSEVSSLASARSASTDAAWCINASMISTVFEPELPDPFEDASLDVLPTITVTTVNRRCPWRDDAPTPPPRDTLPVPQWDFQRRSESSLAQCVSVGYACGYVAHYVAPSLIEEHDADPDEGRELVLERRASQPQQVEFFAPFEVNE